MKAIICDFCRQLIYADDKDAMVYDIAILSSDGYTAKSERERGLLFAADDVCLACTERIEKALQELRTELGRAPMPRAQTEKKPEKQPSCKTCGGEGIIPDEYIQNAVRTCPSCDGTGVRA